MTSFFIHNFGCRATESDAARMEAALLAKGYALSGQSTNSDLVVLNTCTVTAAAEAEAREAIRHIHQDNPRVRIVVTGCYAQRAPEELAALEGVEMVVGNSHQAEISTLIETMGSFVPVKILEQNGISRARIFRGEMSADFHFEQRLWESVTGERTRPILKIQDGCNHRCSYCVIPNVRGKSRSLPPDRIVTEVQQLTHAGIREIVLSGIDIGSYGKSLRPRATLQQLIRRILDETPIERLRLSSIEPMDVTGDFAELTASTDRIARHFHMPLQSGADRILQKMHRWYRTAHYARRVEVIRELMPDAAIGADVIAGFPGETEEDHCETLRFLQGMPLSYLHVFSFSPRPGTEGAALAEASGVPPEVIRRRARELRSLGAEKWKAFKASQEGRNLRVLTLGSSKRESAQNWTPAISGNNLKIRVRGEWPRNKWVDVVFADGDQSLAVVSS